MISHQLRQGTLVSLEWIGQHLRSADGRRVFADGIAIFTDDLGYPWVIYNVIYVLLISINVILVAFSGVGCVLDVFDNSFYCTTLFAAIFSWNPTAFAPGKLKRMFIT